MKKENKRMDLFNISKILLFVCLLFVSVGYSVLNDQITVSGSLVYRYQTPMRIILSSVDSNTNNASITFSPYHKVATLAVGSNLPALDSTITYKAIVTNNSEKIKKIASIASTKDSNTSIIYELSGYTIGEPIMPGESVTLYFTFKYNVSTLPSNKIDECTLLFAYEDMQFTASNLRYDNDVVDLNCADAQCAIEKIYNMIR